MNVLAFVHCYSVIFLRKLRIFIHILNVRARIDRAFMREAFLSAQSVMPG